MEERVYFDDRGVKVTGSRLVIGEVTTYAVSTINSVQYQQEEPSGCLPGAVGVLGLVLALGGLWSLFAMSKTAGGIAASAVPLSFGALMIAAAIWLVRSGKPTYIVALTTSSGQVQALRDRDGHFIHAIVQALNQAIADRV